MCSYVQCAYTCVCEEGHFCGYMCGLSVHVLVCMCGGLCGFEGAVYLLHCRLILNHLSGVLYLLSSVENLGYQVCSLASSKGLGNMVV